MSASNDKQKSKNKQKSKYDLKSPLAICEKYLRFIKYFSTLFVNSKKISGSFLEPLLDQKRK